MVELDVGFHISAMIWPRLPRLYVSASVQPKLKWLCTRYASDVKGRIATPYLQPELRRHGDKRSHQ